MPQPPAYDRQYAFIDFQGSNPDDPLPANQVEIEYNAIKTTLDAILNNLDLIQRDDGALANESVGNDQLEVSLRSGINPPTVWSSSTAYSVNDTVVFSNASRSELWLALEAHTSGSDFDTDADAGKWRQLADWSTLNLDAAQTAYDNSGSGLDAEDVQAAIDELVDDIAAVGGGGVSDGDKGDIVVSGSGATWTIDSGVIDAGKLATDAVETAKIEDAAVTSVKIASSAVITSKLASSAVTEAKINDGAVATAKIADDAVTLAKLAHGTSGDILYYGASGAPTRLAKGTDGQGLVLSSGLPAWDAVGGPTRVRKTSDETVSNSTTLQDDDDLKYALGANEKVRFQVLAFVDSHIDPEVKFAFTVPTGATLAWGRTGGGGTVSTGSVITSSGSSTKGDIPISTGVFVLDGVVENGGTAGDLQLQWAQNAADASNDTKVLTNSMLMAWTL